MNPKQLRLGMEGLNCGWNREVENEDGLCSKIGKCDSNDGLCVLVHVIEVETVIEVCSLPFLCGVSVEGEVSGLCASG